MHEQTTQRCLFGCRPQHRRLLNTDLFYDGAMDNLAHYLICRKIWRHLDTSDDQDIDATSRLGLKNDRKVAFVNIAKAFYMYNAVKHGGHGDMCTLSDDRLFSKNSGLERAARVAVA